MASATCPYLVGKEVLIKGWMVKAPPEKKMKKKTGIAKVINYKWHRRYFVLFKPKGGLPDEYLLEYFTDENCTRKRGSVDLKHCSEIAAFDQTLQEFKIEFVLSLKTIDRNKPRMYYLSCETEAQMNRWVEYLTTVCKMVMRTDDDDDFMNTTTLSNSGSMVMDYNNQSMPTTIDSGTTRRNRGGSADSLSSPNEVFAFNTHNACLMSGDQPPPIRQRSNGVNNARPPRGPPQQNYDILPSYDADADVYHTPPPRAEEYYNMTGGQNADNIYQIPPEMSANQSPHEYINLQGEDQPPSTPPPIVPKRTYRKSFIRKQEGTPPPRYPREIPPRDSVYNVPPSAAGDPGSVYNVPPPREGSVYNVPPPREGSVYNVPPPREGSVYNVPPQRESCVYNVPRDSGVYNVPSQDQNEYLNLWSGAETGMTETVANKPQPRNINDVPPLRPPRSRKRDPNKSSSTSSSSSSCSGSCRSTGSSSGQQQNPTDEHSSIVVETRPSVSSCSSDHVSYIRAEDLFFGSQATESNRPASLTEYNELDKVKTRALAMLAEDISKNSK